MVYNWLGADFLPYAVIYGLSFVVLLVGSLTDLRTREVPDWVNYGLIISGVGLNLLFSAVYMNASFIINSLAGLLIFFGFSYLMFRFGQWGGGDSKMLMGLGAMIGIDVRFRAPQFLSGFFINTLFAGAVYGLLWSIFLAFRNRKKFMKEINKELSRKNIVKMKKIMLVLVLLLMASLFFIKVFYWKIIILSLAFLVLTTFYLWIFVKAIEKSAMYRLVEPSKLTEGDWIVNEVYVGKQYICGPKDLGIEKRQIKKLVEFYKKGKVKKILIKEGIPFVPSFLIAFVVTFIFGNPVVWFL